MGTLLAKLWSGSSNKTAIEDKPPVIRSDIESGKSYQNFSKVTSVSISLRFEISVDILKARLLHENTQNFRQKSDVFTKSQNFLSLRDISNITDKFRLKH